MARHEFTCPDCTARIEFGDVERSATIASGCPICGRPVTATHFATN